MLTLSPDDPPLLARNVRSVPSSETTTAENIKSAVAGPVFPPGLRHPKCGPTQGPCTKRRRTTKLRPGEESRIWIDRRRVFGKGEASAAHVRFVMSRASCRKLEVIHKVWKKRLAGGPLPDHCRKKVDFVRYLLTDMLNEMVADFCPKIIELD